MIRRLVKNIRQKPKIARDNIALGIAGVFTAIVFMFWVAQLPNQFDDIKAEHAEEESSFTQLFSSIKDQFAAVEEAVPEHDGEAVGEENLEVTGAGVMDISNNQVISEESAIQQAGSFGGNEFSWSTSSAPTPVASITTASSSESETNTTSSVANEDRPIRIVTVNKASTTASTSTTR